MTQQLSFQTVTIHRDDCLGEGSYGAVYTATCDELPCAVKVLHNALFQSPDASRQFLQECDILSKLKHPNIVQYLGTSPDPETGNPALLMERMDESLKSFLGRSTASIPFHLEVNLTHDITLALAYLHSQNVIHRDLSSNNVLLIAGCKAKVTDFGMSRWLFKEGGELHAQLTKCPGCPQYMPPEAFQTPPKYSNKLDCFSAGVLVIEILTRRFPNPGKNVELIKDVRSNVGFIQVPYPEIERRKADIELIDPTHPLLHLATQCLQFVEENRPSAKELCRELAAIKKTKMYTQSLQQPAMIAPVSPVYPKPGVSESSPCSAATSGGGSSATELEFDIQLQVRDQQVGELEMRLETLQTENTSIHGELQAVKKENENLKIHISSLETTNTKWKNCFYQMKARHDTEKKELYDRHVYLEQQLEKRESELREVKDQGEVDVKMIRSRDRVYSQIGELRRELSAKTREVEHLKQQRETASKEVHVPQSPRLERERSWSDVTFEFNWLSSKDIPQLMDRGTAVVEGDRCYFAATFSPTIYEYDSQQDEWNSFPDCPQYNFSLVIVNSQLTTVGGMRKDKKHTNVLLTLNDEQKWLEVLPPMLTERSCAAAVCTQKALIVAGGESTKDTLSSIEVMSIDTHKWSAVMSLPRPQYLLSATIAHETLYFLGGEGSSHAVYGCSLSILLHSSERSHKGRRKTIAWHKVPDLPVAYATCTTIKDELIVLGGIDSQGTESNAIYTLDAHSSSWKVIGHMPKGKYRTLTAFFPSDGKLICVGGWTKTNSTNAMEIAQIV